VTGLLGSLQSVTDLLEKFLPVYDISDSVARAVDADVASTWTALLDADLMQVGSDHPVVAALGFMRVLPEIATRAVHRKPMPEQPAALRLRDMGTLPNEQGGWIELGAVPERELALGLVGKFWLPVIEYADVAPEEFPSFAEPGWAKTIYDLRVAPLGEDRTLLSGTMRTLGTDPHARKWFRRYWALGVGSGAHVLVDGLLDTVSKDAEERMLALAAGVA
jgi:hypothetical protein